MTRRQQRDTGIKISPSHFALGTFAVFMLLLFLKNSDIAIKSVSEGLSLCVSSIIPSLFPFMVISEMIVSSGFASIIGSPISFVCKKLFGLSKNGCVPLLLGIVCGSPVGAKSASTLYTNGQISRQEYERLLAFSNTPSSAFLINAVGVSMFSDRSFGIALYFISLASSLIVGILFNLVSRKREPVSASSDIEEGASPHSSPAGLFYSAITSSATAIIYVSAFIIFFSSLTGSLEYVFRAINIPDCAKALVVSILELSGGIKKASSVQNGGRLIAAFASGWSGLSVHFQIMSIAHSKDVSFKPYFISKALQGGINTLLVYLWMIIQG